MERVRLTMMAAHFFPEALCWPVIFFAWPGGRTFLTNTHDAIDIEKKARAMAAAILLVFFMEPPEYSIQAILAGHGGRCVNFAH